jgi:ABC-type bacteriocin/lantibiotic exporter with double-glycine peptidase domain
MIQSNSTTSSLDVPYFQQSRSGTCGPAALMMVMKYWDSSIVLSKKLENKVWLNSNPLVFFGGTLQFGLARTAKKMGFTSEIYQQTKFLNHKSLFLILFDIFDTLLSIDTHHVKKQIYYGQKVLDVINESLSKKIPPIVLVNLLPIIGENVLHWLVVTGINKENIYVNDPYIPKGSLLKRKKGYKIKRESFQQAIATDKIGSLRIPPCVLVIMK